MKKKNISKKVLAILLSVIMIATSVPLGIMSVAAGVYDPAPKFSDEAKRVGARAWLDEEGNVQVTYPEATAEPTYKGEELAIAFYILELVDMGANNVAHQNKVISTIKATGTSATFKATDLEKPIDLETKRYSVTVTAVDTENWFSQPIYTTVTAVPVADIDPDKFAKFSTSSTAVREIMTFDQTDDDTGVVSGNALLYMGVVAEAGTEDLSDNVGDTSALRFIMYNQPNGTQTFDTSMSRQTWDFSNATEIWYWMDLSEVELTNVSFRLRANEKVWYDWGKDQSMTVTQKDYMGDIIYSTKGYTGTDGYVWVQRDDGGWDKVALDGGTVDLGNFKGYVRVPIAFICSENASYAQLKNTGFNNGSTDFATGFASNNLDNGDSHANGIPITKTLVDAAGTNIKNARLMQHRIVATKTGVGGWGNENYWHFTNGSWTRNETEGITRGEDAMIAAGLSEAEVVNDADEGYKAIDDLYSAGFAFEGATADSLEKSFYVDNIFFYDENGGPWDSNVVEGMPSSTGDAMTTYYDEELEISKIIFDEIDKYIADPDWADYRELEYILEMIAGYQTMYAEQGKNADFLSLTRQPATDGLAGMAAKLNRTDTWEKAWLAYEACAAEGTIDTTQTDIPDWFIANAEKDELVPNIVNTMEKLPAPESITAVSEALRKEIVKLWQAYSLLNLGQLEMLGADQEATLVKYFALVDNLHQSDGDEFVVGQRLADNPFIVFNDFENYIVGEKAWKLEDNKDAYTTGVAGGTGNLASDWRHIKSLVTYTTNGSQKITDADYYGYVTTDQDKSQEAMDGKLYYGASEATITNEGYLNSKGVNLYSDSSFTASENNGAFHTITISKDGNPIETGYGNNMVPEQLGSLAQGYSAATSTSVPLALIFYVDFTQVENFYFTVNIFTRDGDGNHVKCRVNTGLNNADRKYWILDNETGEWEIIYTTNQWVFNSQGNQEESTNQGIDYNKIEGYRGYLMIPLYHIKQKVSIVTENKLDEDADLLNNIFAIQFCIGGANASDMDEKSIIIDNVGFTYSKDSYSAASIRNDPSYAEVFGAKSLPAKNFEDAVDAIDPYDESTIDSAVANALALYNKLPDYQKKVVEKAKAEYDIYAGYSANHSTIPQPATTAADLTTWISANLNSDATGASVTGDKDLIYPGFVTVTDENGNTKVVPNYEKYGLTADLAAQLEDFYNNSYVYYTVAEKQAVKDAGFLNAYNAAMRCSKSLESIKTDALTFLPAITNLYTMKYDYNDDGVLDDLDESVADGDNYKVGNFISIEGRAEVESFRTQQYNPLQYYSKTSIDDGSIYPQLTNTSRGFTYFLNNTRTFDLDGDGNIDVQGGILEFRDKMQDIYDMIAADTDDKKGHIIEKTLFSPEELQSIKDILEEYNALLPAYYNVEELYELEQAIIRQFPTASPEFTADPEILLTEDKLTGDASTYKVTYSEVLDLNNKGDKYYVRVTSVNGALTNNYGDSVTYNVAIGSTNATSDKIKADSPYTTDVANNTYTPGSPLNITITPSLSSKPTGLSGAVYDEIKVELVYYETVTTTNEDGTTTDTVVETVVKDSEQTIYVSYSMGDAYTVTIPAEFPVEWDSTDAVDVSYKVTTEMVATSKLTVGVTSDGTGKLISASDSSLKLDYTTENFKTTEFGNRVTNAVPTDIPKITVSGWDAVPVGEYRTTLTYTVVYDDGTT